MLVNASHFNGGTIIWEPIDPNSNGSTVAITVTQRYSWSYNRVGCTTNLPPSSFGGNANLVCIANCSSDGGYSSTPISVDTDCISFSTVLDMTTSERSTNITLITGAYFYIAYQGSAWVNLYTNSASGLDWSISTLIDLRLRSDGIVNSPPVANVLSPQYVIVNTTTLIDIPVSDVNIDDDVRCRWAVNGTINECSDICYPRGLPNDTVLSNCTISFTGLVAGTWYTIAVQIEDFINETSNEPLSSVPVQFLIYVQATPACSIAPVMIGISDCLEVQTNVTINVTLYVMNLCNSSATISEVIISQSISGMTASSVKNSTTNASLAYITLSWKPQTSQIGTQTLCAYAYNSLIVRSTQYCVTFTVTASSPNCPITTVAVITMTNTTAATNKASGMNIPLVVGLSLLGLLVALCCGCCWLYYFLRNSGGRKREKRSEKGIEQPKKSRLIPSFFDKKIPVKPSNATDSTESFQSTNSKSLLLNSKSRPSLPKNTANHNLDQSFSKQSFESTGLQQRKQKVSKIARNKVSVDKNNSHDYAIQRADSFQLFTTSNSVSDALTVQGLNTSVYFGSSSNANRMSENGMNTIVQDNLAPKETAARKKRRQSISIDAEKGSQPLKEEHLSKTVGVTHIKVRSSSNHRISRKDHELAAFPHNIEEHGINKAKVRSNKSKLRKINVRVNN